MEIPGIMHVSGTLSDVTDIKKMLSLSERGLDRWEGTPKGTVESWCKQTSLVTGILALLMKEFRGDTKSSVEGGWSLFQSRTEHTPLGDMDNGKGFTVSLCM